MRLLRSSSVTPNCAPSRRICWHRAQLRGGAVLAAAGQADAPGSNRRARPLRRLCGSRAQTSPHRPKGPRRRRGCNRREPAVPDAARGDRPRPALAPRRASRACYRLPSFLRGKQGATRPLSPECERPRVGRGRTCLGRTPSVSARRAAHARFRQAKRQRGVLRTRRSGRGFPLVLDCVGTDATMALDAATVSVRRLGHGRRPRRRDIATDVRNVRDAAVRSPASPTLTGAARSSSPRSSSSRGPAASTRTWSTCRSSVQPRRASGCARARSTGGP